jgi:hypothetical protein
MHVPSDVPGSVAALESDLPQLNRRIPRTLPVLRINKRGSRISTTLPGAMHLSGALLLHMAAVETEFLEETRFLCVFSSFRPRFLLPV